MIAFGTSSAMHRYVTRRLLFPPPNIKDGSPGRSDRTQRYFVVTIILLSIAFSSTALAIQTSPLFIIAAVVAALVLLLACILFRCASTSRERQKKQRHLLHTRQFLPRQERRPASELNESRSLSEPCLGPRSPTSQERSASGIGNVMFVVLPPLQLTPPLQEAQCEVSRSEVQQPPPDYETAMRQKRPETPPPLYSTLKNLPDCV